MAKKQTVMSQLTSVGESALEQLASSPVTRKALESAMQVKDRVEKLIGALVDIDGRVAALEKRIDALEKAKRTTTRARSSTTKAGTAARTTRAKSTKA